jgi:hypothetical protein
MGRFPYLTNRFTRCVFSLLVAGYLPPEALAANAPMMAVNVPPPAQVLGLNAQVQQGLGVTYTSLETTRHTLRSGSQDVRNVDDERTVNWRQSLILDYNVYRDFTALLSIPYVYNKATFTGSEQTTSGLGDMAVYVKYPIYKDQMFNARQEIQLLGGVEAPTGSTHAKDAQGNLLSATEQAGSGTTNFIVGGALIWGFTAFSLYGDATYKIYGNTSSYRFGNVFSPSAGINYPLPIYPALSLTGEVLGQFVARDHSDTVNSGVLPNGKVNSSGGDTLFIAPGFHWTFLTTWALSASFQVPVYQNLRGTQLKSELNIATALSTRFGGGKALKEIR